MGFSRQEYWNGLLCPSPGDLPDPRDQTWVSYVSCIGRQGLYHWCHLGSSVSLAPDKLFFFFFTYFFAELSPISLNLFLIFEDLRMIWLPEEMEEQCMR